MGMRYRGGVGALLWSSDVRSMQHEVEAATGNVSVVGVVTLRANVGETCLCVVLVV